MIKTAGRATPILNYIAVLLLFALFALQLMPFWSNADVVAEGEAATEISIQGYTWFAKTTQPDSAGNTMSKYFKDNFGKKPNDIVTMPVVIVACCIISIFFGIKNPKRLWMNIVYLTAGGFAAFTYLADPFFQMNSMYTVHLAVAAALIVASILNIAIRPWKRIMHYMKTGE